MKRMNMMLDYVGGRYNSLRLNCIFVLLWYNFNMEFEYDPLKSEINTKKHGVSFEEARLLWTVPSIEIQARTVDEPRFMMIGKMNGKCYSCIYTVRGSAIRIISVRRSRRKEEALYNEHI